MLRLKFVFLIGYQYIKICATKLSIAKPLAIKEKTIPVLNRHIFLRQIPALRWVSCINSSMKSVVVALMTFFLYSSSGSDAISPKKMGHFFNLSLEERFGIIAKLNKMMEMLITIKLKRKHIV